MKLYPKDFVIVFLKDIVKNISNKEIMSVKQVATFFKRGAIKGIGRKFFREANEKKTKN